MKLNDLAEQVGMSKANIRFYEKKGLFLDGGKVDEYYRYTDADKEALLKVKLFRTLRFSLSVVKQLIDGEVSLADVLKQQQEQKSLHTVDAMVVEELCQSMRENQITYATMDVQKYWNQLNKLLNHRGEVLPFPADYLPSVVHPWRRWFARMFDSSVYGLVVTVVLKLMLRQNVGGNPVGLLFQSYCTIGMMLVIEPLLLSSIGTTPGKWIFGLQIRTVNGSKLSTRQAATRTLTLIAKGMGYNIPFYSLYRMVRSYFTCSKAEILVWDEEFEYTIKDTKLHRGFSYVGLAIAIFVLEMLIGLQAELPHHRGDLTASQYYSNVNEILSYRKYAYSEELNNQGQWIQKQDDSSVVFILRSPLLTHQLQLEHEKVTAVVLEFETKEEMWFQIFRDQKYLAVAAFLGAQKELNAITFLQSKVVANLGKEYETYVIEEAGIRVSQEVMYRGYVLQDGQYILPKEGEETFFHIVFKLEKLKK